MTRFALVLTGVTAVIMAVVRWGLDVLPSWHYQTVTFLFISTLGLYYFLVRTKQQRPGYFVQSYLFTLVVKLLAYGAYILLVISKDEAGAVANAGFFMVTYLIFTGLEIGFLYRRVSR